MTFEETYETFNMVLKHATNTCRKNKWLDKSVIEYDKMSFKFTKRMSDVEHKSLTITIDKDGNMDVFVTLRIDDPNYNYNPIVNLNFNRYPTLYGRYYYNRYDINVVKMELVDEIIYGVFGDGLVKPTNEENDFNENDVKKSLQIHHQVIRELVNKVNELENRLNQN